MWALLVVIVALVAVVVVMAVVLRQMGNDLVACRAHDHASCVASVGLMVSAAHSAEALEEAARDYDSIEEQGTLKRLAREHYRPDGPSMPVIWLLDRAAQLREKEHGR